LPEGLVSWAARTATLSPEIRRVYFNSATPHLNERYLFFFFLAFFLAAIGTSFSDSLGWVSMQDEENYSSGEETFILKTLPHFVGNWIITTQLIVCQEKNDILQ
jgi:hypothetical protein